MLRIFKNWVKKRRDTFYSLPLKGKNTLGAEDQWTILTDPLKNPVIYSGGVGKSIHFELEIIQLLNAEVFAFDPTVTGIRTIQSLPINSRLHFYPIALSGKDGELELMSPVYSDEGSFTKEEKIGANQQAFIFPCKKISTLMQELGHTRLDILKIDIEGSEYEVLEDILRENISIDQICVEFHRSNKFRYTQFIRRMKVAGYNLFHRHEMDFSFYHERILEKNRRNDL